MAKFRHWAIEILLFGLLVVALITWHLGLDSVMGVFLTISIFFLVCYLVTSLLLAIVLTWKWQLALHSQGMYVPYLRLFAYRLVGYSVGYLTPTMHAGSEPIRAYLLSKEGIPIDKAFANVIIDKSIEIITNIVFFFIGVLLILNSVLVDPGMKMFVLVLSLLMMLVMGLFIAGILSKRSIFLDIYRFLRLDKIKRLRSIEKNLVSVEKHIEHFYRKKKRYFLSFILIMIVLWALMYFEYRFLLLMLGQKASIPQIFFILTGVGLAYSIPIPAAMGTLELGQISAAKVLQLTGALGVALAFIVRARDLIWTILGLGFMAFYDFRFSKLAKESAEIGQDFEKGKLFKKRGRKRR